MNLRRISLTLVLCRNKDNALGLLERLGLEIDAIDTLSVTRFNVATIAVHHGNEVRMRVLPEKSFKLVDCKHAIFRKITYH